jgi:chromosome segregation ATPase
MAGDKDEINKIKKQLEDLKGSFGKDLQKSIDEIIKRLSSGSTSLNENRKVLNDSKNTVSKINDLSQKLKDHNEKTNTLSSKDLNNIKSKLEQQKSILKGNKDSLQSSIDELTVKKRAGIATATELSQLKESEIIHKNITGGLEKDSGVLDQIISKAQQEAKFRKEIETSLGVAGGILKGMSKIPIIKDIVDTEKILKSANDEIELSGSGLKGYPNG